MRRKQLILISLLGLAGLAISISADRDVPLSRTSVKEGSPLQSDVRSEYGKLPLTFEENRGQSDARVKFLGRGNRYTVFLADDQSATFRLTEPNSPSSQRDLALPSQNGSARAKATDTVVRLSLAGSNPHASVQGLDRQGSYSNYFIGNDPARWQRKIPHYARVKYTGVYPGVDVVYYGHQGQLESDYLVAPGANPQDIQLIVEGAERVKLDPKAGVILSARSGDIQLHPPVAYQEVHGKKQLVAANYALRGPNRIGFEVGSYDANKPLVIDPVLVYATYLGGSGANGDRGSGIAADSSGSAYVTGTTNSTDFPTTTGVVETTLGCTRAGDAFVTKLKPDGSGLVYSTYLGGSCGNFVSTLGGGDVGFAIAVDSSGDAYVTGQTASSDFPTTPNAFQTTNGGGAIFVSKLNPTGTQLLYSTYIHGNGGEYARGIAVDAAGNAYITGITSSTTFPVRAPGGSSPFQSTIKDVDTAFVCRIDPTQTGTGSLVYATYLGGSGSETGMGIAVDSNANVYVTGQTTSNDFPLMNAFQTTRTQTANAFVTRLDLNQASTSALIYSTYLGGTGTNSQETGSGIALDPALNAYVVGSTASTTFPTTTGAFQTAKKNTALSAFVARFDTTKSGGSSLVYSTYLNGSTDEFGNGIAVDATGDAFVTGETASSDFPVTSSVPQPKLAGGTNAFVTEFNPTGTNVLFSTFLGGNGLDDGQGIALDSNSPPNVYVTGGATSKNFPVTAGSFQTTSNPNAIQTGFVAKLTPGILSGVFVNPTSLDFGTVTLGATSAAQMVTLTNGTQSSISITSMKFTGTNALDFSQTATTCGSTLASGANCTISVAFRPKTAAAETASLQINDSNLATPQLNVPLTGSGATPGSADFSLVLSPANSTQTAGATANFTVTVTSLNGFAAAVSLTCTGAPIGSRCTLSPNSVSPAANANASSSGTITTTALLLPPRLPNGPRPYPWIWLYAIPMLVLALFVARARSTSRKLVGAFALVLMMALGGCLSSPNRSGNIKTPPGTYTLTVKGVAGAVNHSAQFSLTVQ